MLDKIWSLWLVRFAHSPTYIIFWFGRLIFSVSINLHPDNIYLSCPTHYVCLNVISLILSFLLFYQLTPCVIQLYECTISFELKKKHNTIINWLIIIFYKFCCSLMIELHIQWLSNSCCYVNILTHLVLNDHEWQLLVMILSNENSTKTVTLSEQFQNQISKS
jgi:hypothetical protein